MPAETTGIPVEGPLATIGAIAYFAVLAYPKESEWPRRDKFMEAGEADHWRLFKDHPDYRARVAVKYRHKRRRTIDNVMSRGLRHIAHRIRATLIFDDLEFAECFNILLEGSKDVKIVIGDQPGIDLTDLNFEPFKRGISAAALRAIERKKQFQYQRCEYPLEPGVYASKTDLQNALNRDWSQSKPVLHLAYALRQMIEFRFMTADNKVQWTRLFDEPDWVGPCLKDAESLRLRFANDPRLNIDEENTVRLCAK